MKSALNELSALPGEYQIKFCWARAVEWQTWVAFLSQPLLPLCYVAFPWKSVLEVIVAFNLVWNIFFAFQMPRLDWAIVGPQWVKLKWLTIPCCAIVFGIHREWLLLVLTLATPIVGALVGALIVRRDVGLIQEFFMLALGNLSKQPRKQIVDFLASKGVRPEDFAPDPEAQEASE